MPPTYTHTHTFKVFGHAVFMRCWADPGDHTPWRLFVPHNLSTTMGMYNDNVHCLWTLGVTFQLLFRKYIQLFGTIIVIVLVYREETKDGIYPSQYRSLKRNKWTHYGNVVYFVQYTTSAHKTYLISYISHYQHLHVTTYTTLTAPVWKMFISDFMNRTWKIRALTKDKKYKYLDNPRVLWQSI